MSYLFVVWIQRILQTNRKWTVQSGRDEREHDMSVSIYADLDVKFGAKMARPLRAEIFARGGGRKRREMGPRGGSRYRAGI